jgi:AcrR family transcriptional regulator
VPAKSKANARSGGAASARRGTAAAKRVTKAEQRAEMTEQILDAAEHLFSRDGLYGVTLKDVAHRVGVHHTLLNYYFISTARAARRGRTTARSVR